MFKISVLNFENKYDFEELIKLFIPKEEFEMLEGEDTDGADFVFNRALSSDKHAVKREIFEALSTRTNYKPAWGTLTGVRPVKLTNEIYEKSSNSAEITRKTLREKYLISEEKTNLLLNTLLYQKEMLGDSQKNSCGVYIGIPFCPTRCVYCSFTSNQKPDSEIRRYLVALKKEIAYTASKMRETGVFPESIYIGGGTPTTLTSDELNELLTLVLSEFDMSKVKEFTVEAGRPDTITREKLQVIKKHGVGRISINPQSMNEKTLDAIGRSHKPSEIIDAFAMAREVGIEVINCDLITGLPGENCDDFAYTLDEILKLDPENITVHTLAVKRASKLIENNPNFNYEQGDVVKEMLDLAKERLEGAGYRPYYLYRQKHMAGGFENIGWCKRDTFSTYNIRIMEEKQHILALGAGGISKIYFPEENRLERVPNVSNYEVYIDRIDEMIQRKEEGFFKNI